MASRGQSRANQNKAIRQEALREQLQAQGHVQHVVEIAEKLSNLSIELDQLEVQRLKAAADIKKGLIAKYIPDMKSIEHSGEIINRDAKSISDEELLSIATGSSSGTTEQANSQKKVH